jgi:DNA-binding transcriptional LysR family regulator
MDQLRLLSFVVIARTGNMKKAATELHVSKTVVSTHLKELEQTFGQVLFERTINGLRLTQSGKSLLPKAQSVIDALNEVTRAAKQIGTGISGHVDLGIVADATWVRAPQVVDILHRHYPELSVSLHQGTSGQVQRDVREGRLAAGWVLGPVGDAAVTSRFLTNAQIRIVGPKAWAKQLETAKVQDLADFPWVDTPEACAYTLHRQIFFANTGRHPAKGFYADTESAHYGLVTEGLALSFMREDLAQHGQRDGQLVLWPGTVPDLRLNFVIPSIRKDELLGRALLDSALRTWKSIVPGRKEPQLPSSPPPMTPWCA